MGGAREGRVDDYILFNHSSNDDPCENGGDRGRGVHRTP